jgi:hypothetical protein
MEKKSDPGPGSWMNINIPDHFSESLKQFFGLKVLKFFQADTDPESFKPWIRDGKVRIRDPE